MVARATLPSWAHERRVARLGYRCVAGLDEVGRGCLAGPVIVGAIVLRAGHGPAGINDSKLLTAARREALMRDILRSAEAWSIGTADAEEIDRINILNATRVAMGRAIEQLAVRPDHLLLDAIQLPDVTIPQTPLIGGDRLSMSIAAASIVAKVVRDKVMRYYDRLFPGFGFASHKGYATAEHLRAVASKGPSPIHRRTFHGVWRQDSFAFVEGGAVPETI